MANNVFLRATLKGVESVKAGLQQIQHGLKSSADAAAVAGQKWREFGKSTSQLGSTLTRNLTLPIAAVGGATIKMAASFEDSLSKITGLVGVSRDQVQEWRKEILKLGPEVGKSPKELADAMFFITSAGLKGASALRALTISAKASAAGLGETRIVADAVTSAINAYGETNLSAAKAADILVATVREGKAGAETLAPVLGRVVPIASQLGISFENVGASLAAMTRLGLNADEAATALRATMSSILKPAAGAGKILKTVGLSMEDIRKAASQNLIEALFKIQKAFKGNDEALVKVFPNIRALSGVLSLVGKNADETRAIFNRMSDTTGDMSKAFQAAADTTAHKWKQLVSSFQSAAIAVGDILLPVFNDFMKTALLPMVDFIKDMIAAFKSLSPETQSMAIKAIALTAAFGPFLKVLGSAIIVLGGLKTAMVALRIAAVFAFTNFPMVAAATAIIGAGLLIIDNWDLIKRNTIEIWADIKIAVLKNIDAILAASAKYAGFVSDTMAAKINKGRVAIQEMWSDAIVQKAKAGASKVKDAADEVQKAIDKISLDEFNKEFEQAWDDAADAVKTYHRDTKQVLSESKREVSRYIDDVQGALDSLQLEQFDAEFQQAFDNSVDSLKKLSAQSSKTMPEVKKETEKLSAETQRATSFFGLMREGWHDAVKRMKFDAKIAFEDMFISVFQRTQSIGDAIRNFFESVVKTILEKLAILTADSLWTGIANRISGKSDSILGSIKDAFTGKITQSVGGKAAQAIGLGAAGSVAGTALTAGVGTGAAVVAPASSAAVAAGAGAVPPFIGAAPGAAGGGLAAALPVIGTVAAIAGVGFLASKLFGGGGVGIATQIDRNWAAVLANKAGYTRATSSDLQNLNIKAPLADAIASLLTSDRARYSALLYQVRTTTGQAGLSIEQRQQNVLGLLAGNKNALGALKAQGFQTGGVGIFTRPSFISVAETGPERVSVQPLAGGSSRQSQIIINGNVVMDEIAARLFAKGQGLALAREAARFG